MSTLCRANVAFAMLTLASFLTLGGCGGSDGGAGGPDGGAGPVGDAGPGEGGDGGVCPEQGEVYCDGECCGEGEACVDGECEPGCPGEMCGDTCCDGDTPVCGPEGQCVRDCESEGEGELCGDELDECCPTGDACVYGQCRTPGEACDGFADCDFGEYCDEGLGHCMPDEFPEGAICQIDYDFDPFEIDELWHWDGIAIGDRNYQNVQSIPVTADMTGDGVPEVVIAPYHGSDQHNGILAVVSGDGGDTVYFNDQRSFAGQGHAAVADVTGDGLPEIAVNLGEADEGVAMVENPANCPDPEADPDDCIRWEVRSGTLDTFTSGTGPAFADIRGDGVAEVVVGAAVIDASSGDVIADGDENSRAHNGLERWGAAALADLDGDGTLELLTGDCAWKVDFDENELVEYWCNDGFSNGIPAVADIVSAGDRGGLPEVAVVRSGTLRVLDGQSGDTIHSIEVPGDGDGGPPNIADFDGDGTAEIGLPGEQCYSVFDVDCIGGADEPGACEQPEFPDCTPGEPLPDGCPVDPCDDPALTDGSGEGVLWSVEVQDGSMTTGSSVFDFQGNGRSEVVYNDECRLLVLDGQTGQPHISRINTTRTATEYPLVVDVNGDGRSNIAVIANNDQYSRDCEGFLDPQAGDRRPDWFPECFEGDPGDRPAACDEGTSGIFAFEDVHDAWVRTRSIWNQHAYHITNIEDDGTLPTTWEPPWERFNTFRANRQGAVPLNAPDVAIRSLEGSRDACPGALEVMVTVENTGVSSIPAGLPVTMYRADTGDAQPVETLALDAPVSPGGAASLAFSYELGDGEAGEDFDFLVVANDDGTGEAPIFDCDPESASALLEDLGCGVIIE